MRRSFGPMGGGGPGMMKTVHRAVRATSGGCGSTSSHNTSTNSPTSRPTYKPSSSDDNNVNTISFISNHHPSPSSSINPYNEYDDFVFSTVPSVDEVHRAVSSLQQALDPTISSDDSGWELDWIEPSTSMMQSRGSKSVCDAFHLLQTEPSVKRMVISLSSDKSVWEAIMNNEAVRELRDSVYEANKSISGRSDDKFESSDGSVPVPVPVPDVLHWIFINTKTKVTEIVENITEMVNKLFQSTRNEKKAMGEGAATEPFEKKLSSFLLSVMVILIVVVSRASRS